MMLQDVLMRANDSQIHDRKWLGAALAYHLFSLSKGTATLGTGFAIIAEFVFIVIVAIDVFA